MVNTILGFCCINRQKDDSLHERYTQSNSMSEYIINSRPHLPNVLNMFNSIEKEFREGLKTLNKPLEDLMHELEVNA